MISGTARDVPVDFLVAIETQARLALFAETRVTARALCLVIGVSLDDRTRHHQGFELY